MKRTLNLSLFLFFIAFSASTSATNSQDSTVFEQVSDEKSSEESTLLTNFQKTKLSLKKKHAEQKVLRDARFAQTTADIITAEEQGNPLFFPLKITRILERSTRETLEQHKKFKENPLASKHYNPETNPWTQLEPALKIIAESLKQKLIKKKQNPVVATDQAALVTKSTEAVTDEIITKTTDSEEKAQQKLPPAEISKLTKIKNGIILILKVLISRKERTQLLESLKKPSAEQTLAPTQAQEETKSPSQTEKQPTVSPAQPQKKPQKGALNRLASLFRSNNKDEFGTFSFDELTTDKAFENDELCELEEPFNHKEYFKNRTYLKEYVPLPPKQQIEDVFKPIYARTGVDSTYWSRKVSWFMGLAEEDCNLSTIVSQSALPLVFDVILAISKTFYTSKYTSAQNSLRNRITPFVGAPNSVLKSELLNSSTEFVIKISLIFIQYLLSHCVMEKSLHGIKNALWTDPSLFFALVGLISITVSVGQYAKMLSGTRNSSTINNLLMSASAFLPYVVALICLAIPLGQKVALLIQVEKELADNPSAIGLKKQNDVPHDMRGHKYMVISDENIIETTISTGIYPLFSLAINIVEKELQKNPGNIEKMKSNKNILESFRLLKLIMCNSFSIFLNLIFGLGQKEKYYIRDSDLEFLTPVTKNKILTLARKLKIHHSLFYGFILGENIKDLVAISKQVPSITKEGHRMFKNWRQGIKPIDLSVIKNLLGFLNTSPEIDKNLTDLLRQAEKYQINEGLDRVTSNQLIAWFLSIKSTHEGLSPADRIRLPKCFTNEHINKLNLAAQRITADGSIRSAVEAELIELIR